MEVSEAKRLFLSHPSQPLYLVPFFPQFIPLYTQWLSDPLTQRETCSEGVCLKDIQSMQERYAGEGPDLCLIIYSGPSPLSLPPQEMISGLVGDVSLFGEGEAFEVNIMIGDRGRRRQGLGRGALQTVIHWLRQGGWPDKKALLAKIDLDNAPSLAFFKEMGFQKVKDIEAFKQVELKLDI